MCVPVRPVGCRPGGYLGGYTGWVLYRVLPHPSVYGLPLTSSPRRPPGPACWGFPGESLGGWDGVRGVLLEEGPAGTGVRRAQKGPGVPVPGPDAL